MNEDIVSACENVFRQGGSPSTDYSELRRFDKRLVVAQHVRAYSKNWVCGILQKSPWLWQSWTTTDWLFEMSAVGPRYTHDEPMLDLNAFSDLCFLVQYLRLDGFKVFVTHSNATPSEKKDAINRLRQHFPILKPQDDWFESVTFENGENEESIRNRLIEEGVFKPFDTRTAHRGVYIKELGSLLD